MGEGNKDSVDTVHVPQVNISVADGIPAEDVGSNSKDTSTDKNPSHETERADVTLSASGNAPKQKDTVKSKGISVDDTVVPQKNTDDLLAIDKASRSQNAIDSDRDYRRITEKIIDETCGQLKQHTKAKDPLRKKLSRFIIIILSVQFAVLVAVMFLNRIWNLQISDFILNVYIVSVFVETLAGLIIMINFAFNSKQEVELISILNAIIINFKKYEEK